MNILVLDLETIVQKIGGKTDNSPYHPDNKCVSSHTSRVELEGMSKVKNLVFHHNEKDVPDSPAPLQDELNWATVLVCQNAKFDVTWLLEMGFDIPDQVYCTMIGEYILSKGQKRPLSLKAIAERREVTRKKSDLVDDLFQILWALLFLYFLEIC